MNDIIVSIFNKVNLNIQSVNELPNKEIPRQQLISIKKYDMIKNDILKLKHYLSSSFFSSLHKNADIKQKFPLINLLRQVLKIYSLQFKPMRKSAGYDITGKKKYYLYYQILQK